MAIVPITKDISMLQIRKVLNERCELLGIAFGEGSDAGRYGAELSTGKIFVVVKNIGTTDYASTVSIQVTKGGSTPLNTTTALNSGQQKNFSVGGLTAGTYTITLKELSSNPDRVDTASVTLEKRYLRPRLARADVLRIKVPGYSLSNISMASNDGNSTDDNYSLGIINKYNMKKLPSTRNNADLSDWRGTQTMSGIIGVAAASTGYYGGHINDGSITVKLDPSGFGTGSVNVKVRGVGNYYKNVSSTNNYIFKYGGLKPKTYYVEIEDLQTGNKVTHKVKVTRAGYDKARDREWVGFSGTESLRQPFKYRTNIVLT